MNQAEMEAIAKQMKTELTRLVPGGCVEGYICSYPDTGEKTINFKVTFSNAPQYHKP